MMIPMRLPSLRMMMILPKDDADKVDDDDDDDDADDDDAEAGDADADADEAVDNADAADEPLPLLS
eukprot:11324434-Karenia_brevis.AAC.1